MKESHRALVAGITIGFVAILNLIYLLASNNGKSAEYAKQIDTPQIQILSLMLVVLLIALAVTKPKENV